jgi:hypothetical protein
MFSQASFTFQNQDLAALLLLHLAIPNLIVLYTSEDGFAGSGEK